MGSGPAAALAATRAIDGTKYPSRFFGALNSTGLRSLLRVAIELPGSPLSFSVAIRRMGGFVSVVLAHSMQSLFYGGCSRSKGLQMEQLREFE